MIKIGVISDTHFPTKMSHKPAQVAEVFKGVSLILHAGDINNLEILKWLSGMAPVVAIAGNSDDREVVRSLGYVRSVFVAGYHIGLTHGHQGATESFPDRALHWFPEADIVVFGHTHEALQRRCPDGRYLLNPGSCGVPNKGQSPTVAILTLDDDLIDSAIIKLEQ